MKRHIPNLITCLNLLTGALGCIEIVEGRFENAIYYVAVAGLFDFLDGFAARLLSVKSDIGKELDSLADMVSFGLLPALFMMQLLKTGDEAYLPYFGLLIAVFSALRLAKFNVDTRQTDQFIGLPTPANTLLITSLVFFPIALPIWVLLVITTVSCFLMVAPFPLLALKFKSFGWKGNEARFILVVSCVLLLIVFKSAGLTAIVPLYLILSFIGNFMQPKTV